MESVRTVQGGFDNTRVKGAPRLAQEHAVGRVLHQGVLEQVARIRWDALPRQQTGFQQGDRGSFAGRLHSLAMSAYGTNRTWPDVRLESAFGGTAEVEFRGRQLR